MRAQKKGWDVLLAFEYGIGPALAKACELNSESEAIQLVLSDISVNIVIVIDLLNRFS